MTAWFLVTVASRVDLVGEGDLDDAVDAVGGVGAHGLSGIGLVQGDGVRDDGGGRVEIRMAAYGPITVAPPQRASCAALRAQRPPW